MTYNLFKIESNVEYCPNRKLDNYTICEFSPNFFHFFETFEKWNFRTFLFRLYSFILTRGGMKVYYMLNEKKQIVHFSYLIPPNLKYSFLKKGDAVIGPCNTAPEERGKGLYPFMLSYIRLNNPNINFYLVIRKENIPSIRGAEKAGFVDCGNVVKRTSLLHRFVLN